MSQGMPEPGAPPRVSILIVEDSIESQRLIRYALEKNHELTFASTAREALATTLDRDFHMVLLDVVLPDGDGFELLTQMLKTPKMRDVPVVFLSRHGNLEDKLKGFELGAEDYLVKPVDPLELAARVTAKLKHRPHPESHAAPTDLVRGALRIDVINHRAFLQTNGREEELVLTTTEYRILRFLCQHPDKSLTREQIIKACWDKKTHVMGRTIDRHMSSLRQKLGAQAFYLHSVHGEGYCFSLAQIPHFPKKRRTAEPTEVAGDVGSDEGDDENDEGGGPAQAA